MLEDMMYQKFLKLTDRKKIDYLYTYLVEEDDVKLSKKYGPSQIDVLMEDDEVIIKSPTLKTARVIRNSMIMEGMILLDENYHKEGNTYIVSYLFEGNAQPICLN